ncbi:MAG: hypothetical protein WD099_09450, partial [Dongiaceae bacterium]
MTNNALVTIANAVFADIAVAFGVPSATPAAPFRMYLEKKAREARDRLLDEMRKGGVTDFEVAAKDEAIAVIYRVAIAARDGAEGLSRCPRFRWREAGCRR